MDYIPANQLYDSDATIDADKETEDEDEIDDEGNVIILSPASECLILSGQSILEGGQDGNHESGSQHGGASDYIPDISVDDRLARRPAMAKVYKKFKRQPGAPVRHGDMAEFVVALCDDGRGRRTSARTRRARSVDSERVISSQTTVSESSSTNASSRTSTRRRRPSSKKPRNVRRGRDPVRVQIAALVRSHAFDMMDRTRAPVGPDPITSVSLAHVTRYATTKRKEHGPNEDHLELFLDFRSVLPTSRPICNVWNTQAGAVFTANFLRQYPEYQTQRAIVLACFKAHLRQLENQFNRFSAFDDEETREKAVVDRKVQLRRERCSRRIKTLEAFRGKSATVDRLAKLSRNKFDWKVCSGDDTDSDGEKVITTLDWRAEEVRPMFRIVDLLTLVLRFPDGVHATSGQFPQHRYDPVDAREHGEPVLERRRTDPQRGLPENFYNPTWLRSLDEDARERLEMTRPISFEFPRALVGLAETAVPVKDRKSKPLPRNWDI
ncbi:hypothetical protein DFP72DRAFT_575606 [Ephemerocybe angulata]|uniref:Uncharacterized protein n=1 Tax=Ephemerocybe angulata TaxID=980116 RepID=A0A8H6HKJ1_9AGAR|nr:hypothetical protein DFP72DRAFT_575606 [Tulosesus angulatus]